MWDNIYHEPLTSSVLFKYNIKINEHEYQISLLFVKKKENVFGSTFQISIQKTFISNIIWEILHKLFGSSSDSKKYRAFEFDNHLLRIISILQVFFDPKVYIAVSISGLGF